MRQTIEEAEEIISDQAIIIALQQEELAELRSREKVLVAQVQALMKGQKVEYEVAQ